MSHLNWKKYIDSFECEVHYAEPATKEQINEVERQLGVKLPPKLLALLNQTNGVFDEHRCHYVWPTNRFIEDNLYFRQFEDFKDVFMPFDHLLFFSDSGCGDLFAFKIMNGHVQTEDVFVWEHETDSRKWVASSLETFLKGWITGELSI